MQNSEIKNKTNFDFERSILYTRKQPDEINLQINNTNNVKKPLPIHFKPKMTNNIDSRFTINPITGINPLTNERPINSYQNKKEYRSEMGNRIAKFCTRITTSKQRRPNY